LNTPGILGLPSFSSAGNLESPLFAALVAGYFVGSIPFGYLVARAHGVNIFEQGSRSSGATNVRRVVGAHAGNTVFALDLLKGALVAAWPLYYLWRGDGAGVSPDAMLEAVAEAKLLGVAGVVAAVVGHSFSCFARFRGGKGVATASGGFLVLMPGALLVAAGVWAACFFSTRYVSLASMVSVTALPVAAWFLGEVPFLVIVTGVVAAFVVLRHRANIGRLLRGTENRFGSRRGSRP
jgi:glycerol-3-phosphate acyltransferase PlsY